MAMSLNPWRQGQVSPTPLPPQGAHASAEMAIGLLRVVGIYQAS